MDSFVELFSDAPLLSFSIMDTLYTGSEHLAIHLVREEIQLEGQVVSIMVSTNIYQRESGGWRMLLHHASPEPDAAMEQDFDEFRLFEDAGFDEFDDDPEDSEEPQRPPVLH